MTLNWSQLTDNVKGSDIINSQNLIISEINENDPVLYISNILGDTCPPNYNHQITIYGQNFRPNSTVNIPNVSNLVTTIISPTEIVAQFTSGSIVGAFDVEIVNDGKSSALWGQNNKLNIINATGGNLPLLDTWIDCRLNGSPDAMIGEILKVSFSTWTRGVFGYVLTALSSTASNWLFNFRFDSYVFPLDFPLSLEFIIYNATYSSNFRWGLLPQSDLGVNTINGFQYLPNNTFSYFVLGHGAAPVFSQMQGYVSTPYFANTYTKIIIKKQYIAFCDCDPTTFETTAIKKEFFIDSTPWNDVISALKSAGYTQWGFGLRFNPSGVNLTNYSHLTAFKLSWA